MQDFRILTNKISFFIRSFYFQDYCSVFLGRLLFLEDPTIFNYGFEGISLVYDIENLPVVLELEVGDLLKFLR